MAGRPRKNCKRKKNGVAVTYKPVNLQKEIVVAQRLAAVAQALAGQDISGTPAGLLFLQKFLNEEQLNADLQFSILVRRYAAITGLDMGPPKVVSMDIAGGGGGGYDPDETEIEAVKQQYARAHHCLKLAGTAAMREVTNCTVFQNECSDRHAFRRGLAALSWLFTLTAGGATRGQRKRAALQGNLKPDARPKMGIIEKSGD